MKSKNVENTPKKGKKEDKEREKENGRAQIKVASSKAHNVMCCVVCCCMFAQIMSPSTMTIDHITSFLILPNVQSWVGHAFFSNGNTTPHYKWLVTSLLYLIFISIFNTPVFRRNALVNQEFDGKISIVCSRNF